MSQSAEPAPIEMVYEVVPQLERWELRDEDLMPDPAPDMSHLFAAPSSHARQP